LAVLDLCNSLMPTCRFGSKFKYRRVQITGFRSVCLFALVLGSFFALQCQSQNPQVSEAFQRGATAMKNGQTEVAERSFREAVRLAPDMPEAHLDLGLVLGRAGKIDEAIDSIRKALAIDPNLESAHLFLGIFLYQANKPEEARKQLQIELAVHSDNVEALTWLGTIDLALGHPERAVASFDHAALLDPDNLSLLEFRGRAHNLVARDSYARMAKIDPGSWHVHRVQAQLYSDEGKHTEAIKEYLEAIKLEARNPDLYEELGDEYRSLNRLDAAEEAYQKGFDLSPANPVAMYNLGSTKVERAELQEGVRLLKVMMKAYPNSQVAEYYLGRGLADLGNNEEALVWLQKSAAGDHDGEVSKRSWYELSRLYRKLHRTEEAGSALANFNRIRQAQEKANYKQMQDWKKLAQSTEDRSGPETPDAGPSLSSPIRF